MNTTFFLRIFLIYLASLIFVIAIIIIYRKRIRHRQATQRFYRGLVTVFHNTSSDADFLSQIQLLHSRLISRYDLSTGKLRSLTAMMEDVVYLIDTSSASGIMKEFGTDEMTQMRPRLLSVLILLRQQPFPSISSVYANLLIALKHAAETQNLDLINSTARQIAEGIDALESQVSSEIGKNETSFIISGIGVFFTIVFGTISLIQLFL